MAVIVDPRGAVDPICNSPMGLSEVATVLGDDDKWLVKDRTIDPTLLTVGAKVWNWPGHALGLPHGNPHAIKALHDFAECY